MLGGVFGYAGPRLDRLLECRRSQDFRVACESSIDFFNIATMSALVL